MVGFTRATYEPQDREALYIISGRRQEENNTTMAKGDVVLDLEQALFVLQKKDKDSGEWETQGIHTYRGRSDALTVLQRLRGKHPEEEWRAMLKQEAERYREGWKDCVEFVRRKHGIEAVMAEPGPASAVYGSGRASHVPPGRE